MLDFSQFQAVFLDLDGTIYNAHTPLPGAVELVRRLQDERRIYACLSNSTDSPRQVTLRLADMKIAVDREHIFTAAAAAADYVLHARSRDLPRVFNLATAGLHELLDGQVTWTNTPDDPCDFVVVGTSTGEYAPPDRQRIALELLRRNAALVGICADRVYPSPRGIEFGAGALCAMLTYASGVVPKFCGKPEPLFFHELCDRVNVSADRCILIGDNLESDIAGAKAVGMRTALVMSGVTRPDDLTDLTARNSPDFVIPSLLEI